MHTPDSTTINQLAKLDMAERTYVDVYEAAIAKVADPYVRQQLEECQRSHGMRCDILAEEIEDLGGAHDADARLVGVALPRSALGEDSAIAALHDFEDVALAMYREVIPLAAFDVRDLIEGDLLPEQERTHAIIASLKTEH